MSEQNQLLEGDLAQIIASYMRHIDAGDRVDQRQMLIDHPHLKVALESYFADVALIEKLAGPMASDFISPTGIEVSGDATCGTPVVPLNSEQSGNQNQAGCNQELGGQFGRYQIEKILGQGAMGAVYLAYDTELERRVALKVPKIEDVDGVEELLARFYREARAAATLEHGGICRVYDVGSQEGITYIAMAYIDGMPLSSFIKSGKIKSMRNISVVIRKLALALESAHQKGVIHRDVKPANIMMDESKEPVIMDFGLARQLNKEESARLTMVGTVMGTPAYMSPEQVSGDIHSVGCQSDIYSLGVILYELLTGGVLPFQGPVVVIIGQIIGTDPSPPSSIKEGVDPELEAICLKMMAKKTEDRYQSMQEVFDVLTAYLKNNAKSTTASPQPFPKLRKPKKKVKAKQRKQREQRKQRKQRKTIIVAACTSILFLAAAITIFFEMDDRIVAVKLDDSTAKVTIDGKYHVDFDGDMGHVELDVGPHDLTVTRGGAVIKVSVTKDGAEVKDQGEFAFTVEKHGKNLLEIKVLDQVKPPKKVVAVLPKKAVTASPEKPVVTTEKDLASTEESDLLSLRLAEILKQKPVGVQEFDFKRKLSRDAYGTRVFHNGRMIIDSSTRKKELRAWPFAAGYGSALVQVDVQTVEGNGWGIVFHSKILKRGFRITLDKKKLEFGPSLWEPKGTLAKKLTRVLTDKAPTKGPDQFDQLHVLIEGRTITVILNGEQCGAPVELDFDLEKHHVSPGIVSGTIYTKVEFERILYYPLLEKLDQTLNNRPTESRKNNMKRNK
ncbi:MAG: serine/threonine-protein kinase [Gimesia sp.]